MTTGTVIIEKRPGYVCHTDGQVVTALVSSHLTGVNGESRSGGVTVTPAGGVGSQVLTRLTTRSQVMITVSTTWGPSIKTSIPTVTAGSPHLRATPRGGDIVSDDRPNDIQD